MRVEADPLLIQFQGLLTGDSLYDTGKKLFSCGIITLMGRIRLLPDEVASQVAAGEVVERPASVVKELVENSLDAGATRIEVAARRGGISEIIVSDDGCGMDREDALLCLERHATSKLRTGADLAAISSLGFRGEALPSIASVSRFRLATRPHEVVVGTEIVVNAGRIVHVRDSGTAPGTRIEVRSLFYNLPARRKFLRTEQTESAHLEHALHLLALSHPSVAFAYIKDGNQSFHLPAKSSLRDRINDLYGRDLASRLLTVESAWNNIRISGLIGKPGLSRADRSLQIIFVNGRAVEDAIIARALREGYHTALMRGQHPVTFLLIELDPATVDVNVHPAKREVRFRDGRAIHEAVVRTVRDGLESYRAGWGSAFQAPKEGTSEVLDGSNRYGEKTNGTNGTDEVRELIPPQEQVSLRRDWSEFAPPAQAPLENVPPKTPPAVKPSPPAKELDPPRADASQFRVIGVLGKTYILMENSGGLVLVDQHAAHERILFEQLRRRMEQQGVPSQRLLLAQTFQLPPRDAAWLRENLAGLQKMGLGIEEFGTDAFKIESLPPFLGDGDPLPLIMRVIDELRGQSSATSKVRLGEEVIARTVCRHAVKANDPLGPDELIRLIEELLDCDLPYCCPHGRPTMIQIAYEEIEKKFGRQAPTFGF